MSGQYGYERSNPYDQRGGVADLGYGAPSPKYGGYNNAPAMGRDDYSGSNVEMEPLTGTGTSFPRQADPNAILNECRDIDRAIVELKALFEQIEGLQQKILNNGDTSNRILTKNLENATTEVMAIYRNLTGRVKNIKQKPESGSPKNAPQVGKVDRDLKETLNQWRQIEADYTRRSRDKAARQYRIVSPDATEEEVQRAIDDPNAQVFSLAVMNSNRRGQAQSTKRAVEERHEAIAKITKQFQELNELFQDMDNLVVQQEAAVVNIEMKGEEVVENMDKGTEQIGVAIQSARNARKWKWWCLGIVVLIIIIIVVIVLIYKFVIQTPAKATAKRFVLTDSVPSITLSNTGHAVVPGKGCSEKLVVPGVEWKGDKLVVPGTEHQAEIRKFRRFQA
jgi:syntaxin 1B/2/3